MNNYSKEVKERWGSTDSYREYEQKTEGTAEFASAAIRIFCSI